ncbi:hypothetical protein ACVWW1_000719 [Bradyrhizobium sp. JR3.5]
MGGTLLRCGYHSPHEWARSYRSITGNYMHRVLTCLTLEHDWRLVAFGGVICLLASAVDF